VQLSVIERNWNKKIKRVQHQFEWTWNYQVTSYAQAHNVFKLVKALNEVGKGPANSLLSSVLHIKRTHQDHVSKYTQIPVFIKILLNVAEQR
jgi:hypothetical protein